MVSQKISESNLQMTDPSLDMARVTAEMRQLRDDESKLRQENLQLQVKY